MVDEEAANRALRFISKLKHTKGRWKGLYFDLQDWQKAIIRDLFGTVNANGARQYRMAYVEIPRKNGKSELAAAVALKLLFADSEPGAEIYSAAADREQAAIVFTVAIEMVRQSPALAKRCKIIESTRRIVVPATNSVYRVLSADHATKHGFNAHGIIFDELHTQPTRHLWDVLTTSGGTRRQPLVFAITTAGYDRHSICWEQHEYAHKVRQQVIEDPTFYPVIYAAEETDDWLDEKVWAKTNPALGVFRDIDEMRQQARKAEHVPAYENTFRRLYLNQWTRQESKWLSLLAWDASAGEIYEEDLEGEVAFAGLDLATVTDIAACVLVFPDSEDCYDVLPIFWVPEESMRERSDRDRVPYDVWVQKGYLRTTPGNAIDFRQIRKDIGELGERFNIREIAFDRWGAEKLRQELEDDGFPMVEFGQGFVSMAHPTKELLRLILEKRLRHGGHPVLRWMADNLVVRQDPAGNVKPDKEKSSEKIDGVVALIMGLDRALRHKPSIYEKRGLRTL